MVENLTIAMARDLPSPELMASHEPKPPAEPEPEAAAAGGTSPPRKRRRKRNTLESEAVRRAHDDEAKPWETFLARFKKRLSQKGADKIADSLIKVAERVIARGPRTLKELAVIILVWSTFGAQTGVGAMAALWLRHKLRLDE